MENIIFVDIPSFEEIETELINLGFKDFITVFVGPRDDANAWVKRQLDSSVGAGSFSIVTYRKNKFSACFPNNTIDIYCSDGQFDAAKVAKQIVYVMTNFGREDKNHDRVFITSDTHFNHANIIKYCNRPWETVEEMNDDMVERWNETVGKDDKVIHLGDFAFGNRAKVESVFKRLNGRIDLVMGNHDRLKIREYYEMGFHRVYDRPILYSNFFILSHAPIQWVKDGGVYANIYGHVHDMEMYNTVTRNTFCACVERHGYRPVRFDDIKTSMCKFE